MRRLKFTAGQVIIEENTVGESAYILNEGKVDVVRKGENRDVILATLEGEQTFGELGLIDDRPRTASVVAATDVQVTEIVRSDFSAALEEKGMFLVPIIRTLFERLRQANDQIVELQNRNDEWEFRQRNAPTEGVRLEALTSEARNAIGGNEYRISKLPFKIGRKSRHVQKDIFTNNDLNIQDHKPYSISRNHLVINFANDEWFLVDRGSRNGTNVNGKYLGTKNGVFRTPLHPGNNLITLGGFNSPFQFRLVI